MEVTETSSQEAGPKHRLDVPLHSVLTSGAQGTTLRALEQPLGLSDPVFPQYPELVGDVGPDPLPPPSQRHYTAAQIYKSMRGWMFPWIKSRILPGDFQPIIAYLFTEWKCNLDCHYGWAFDNRIKGMSEEVPRPFHRLASQHALPRACPHGRRAASASAIYP